MSNIKIKKLYEEILKNKINAIRIKTTNNVYESAYYEGHEWMELGLRLEAGNPFSIQAYICLSYAAELFLKALLIKNNKKVDNKHNLKILYDHLNRKYHSRIEKNIIVQRLDIRNEGKDKIIYLDTFDDYISYISNSYVDLRYDFERVQNDEYVALPSRFLTMFTYSLYEICDEEIG